VLDPVVTKLERLRVHRWAGVSLVYATFLVLLAVIIIALAPPIYREAVKLPGYVARLSRRMGLVSTEAEAEQAALEALGETFGLPQDADQPESTEALPSEQPEVPPPVEPEPAEAGEPGADRWLDAAGNLVRQNLDRIAVKVLASFKAAVVKIAGSVGQVVGAATQVVLVFVYTFFFLLGLHPGIERIKHYLPGRYRDRIIEVARKLDRAYAGFFRGRLIVCLCSGILTSAGLWICGIPFWLLIGMTVGVLGVIPFIGVMVGLVPAVLLAVLIGGWKTVIGVLVVFAVVQCVEPLLTPIVLSRGVRLHPLTILIGLLVGAELFGLFGAVISVPLASTAKILSEEFLLPPLRELAEEEPVPPAGTSG